MPSVLEAEVTIEGEKPVVCLVEDQFTGSASVHASAIVLKVNSPAFSAFIEAIGGNDQTLMQDVIYIPSGIVETTIGQTTLQGNVVTPLQKGSVVRAWRALLKQAGMAPPSLGAAMPIVASAPSKVALVVLSLPVTPSQLPQHVLMSPEETQPSTPAPPPGTLYPSQEEWRTLALQGSEPEADSHPTGGTHSKRKFSSILAPGDDREFSVLPPKIQRKLEEVFTQKNDGAAREYEGGHRRAAERAGGKVGCRRGALH